MVFVIPCHDVFKGTNYSLLLRSVELVYDTEHGQVWDNHLILIGKHVVDFTVYLSVLKRIKLYNQESAGHRRSKANLWHLSDVHKDYLCYSRNV